MVLRLSKKSIPFYRFLLRFIALKNRWVKRDEFLEAWSEERNNERGVSEQYIYETLMKLFEKKLR